jgi:hypothetical protein
VTGLNLYSVLVSVFGAVLFLVAYHVMRRRNLPWLFVVRKSFPSVGKFLLKQSLYTHEARVILKALLYRPPSTTRHRTWTSGCGCKKHRLERKPIQYSHWRAARRRFQVEGIWLFATVPRPTLTSVIIFSTPAVSALMSRSAALPGEKSPIHRPALKASANSAD